MSRVTYQIEATRFLRLILLNLGDSVCLLTNQVYNSLDRVGEGDNGRLPPTSYIIAILLLFFQACLRRVS